jgi:hypothetical protein
MSKIFGIMSREDRRRDVTLGSEKSIRIEVKVGGTKNSKKIAVIEVYEYEKGMFRLVVNGNTVKEVLVEDDSKGEL